MKITINENIINPEQEWSPNNMSPDELSEGCSSLGEDAGETMVTSS